MRLEWPIYNSRAQRFAATAAAAPRQRSGGGERAMAALLRRVVTVALGIASLLALGAVAQLSPTFYDGSCPSLQSIVRSGMAAAVQREPRMGASILRLFFHDCFVNGCDASVLLDDSSTLTGEKNAAPNANSLRGFEVIDSIKSQVEGSCAGTVSCADILAIAARDGVNLLSTLSSPRGCRAMAVFPAARLRPLLLAVAAVLVARGTDAQLSAGFYSASCPTAQSVVRLVMSQAIVNNTRNGAAILRLFFHDCFVNGCDASLLLDDTPTTPGEKGAGPNAGGSTFGFEIIDTIKTQVEAACPATVSCADILALAARDSVNLLGGPSWAVPLGRRDALSPNPTGAATDLPGPNSDLSVLVAAFAAKGLTSRELTALSGAHTIGMARCASFRTHVYCDANVSPMFALHQRQACPASGGDSSLAPLDSLSPAEFDNGYYQDLVAGAGLLHSDQELFNNGPVDSLVRLYSTNANAFSSDFAASMVRLGNISPLTGSSGEIRLNCRKVNS